MFAKALREENDSLIYQLAISNRFLTPKQQIPRGQDRPEGAYHIFLWTQTALCQLAKAECMCKKQLESIKY